MKKILVIIMLLAGTSPAFAESYLCAADAGAIVEDGANRPATALLADVSDSKYVVTQTEGRWGLKILGQDHFLFDQCVISDAGKPSFCEIGGDMFGGSFLMNSDGRFSILWMTQANGRDRWVVAKGRCSTI